MKNWYKKNRPVVALFFLLMSAMGGALNIAGEIIKPDLIGAVSIVVSFISCLLWLSIVMEYL